MPSPRAFKIVSNDIIVLESNISSCARPQKLFAEYLSLGRFQQASEQTNDSQRKLFGAFMQVVFFLHHFAFPLSPGWRTCPESIEQPQRGGSCQPRATPWDYEPQSQPSPEGAA